jgi:hypothetical protein
VPNFPAHDHFEVINCDVLYVPIDVYVTGVAYQALHERTRPAGKEAHRNRNIGMMIRDLSQTYNHWTGSRVQRPFDIAHVFGKSLTI